MHGALESLVWFHKAERGWSWLTDRRSDEEAKTTFYRSVWQEAAQSVGACFESVSSSLYQIRAGEVGIRVYQNYTSLDDPVTLRLAGDKPLVHRLLQECGIPVPPHSLCRYDDLRTASRFMEGLNGPCVVKPARGTAGGAGVTAGVADRGALARAMARAAVFGRDVLVEQYVVGQNYRLLYLDGALLDAVLRSPPTVTGDGMSTIRQLIARENNDTQKRVGLSQRAMAVDGELKRTLRGQGLGLRSIPAVGEVVRLKDVISDNRRDDNQPARILDPSVIEAGAAAALAVGVRLAGVDIVTPDPARPLADAAGAVIEVNTTPSLYYHYPPRLGSLPVAVMILQRVLARGPRFTNLPVDAGQRS